MHMLWIALAFLFGDVWVQLLPDLSLHTLRLPLCVAIGLLLLSLLRRWPKAALIRLAIVAFLAAIVWSAWIARSQLQQDLEPALEGEDIQITGYIASIPEVESYGVRFVFNVDAAARPLPKRLELTWYQPAITLHAAERWQFMVRLKRRHGFANPGGYDYEAQLFRDGIGATGYIRDAATSRLLGTVTGERVLKARAMLSAAISRAIPDAPMQGVIRGLAVGDQQAINGDAWRVFARTGTSHLMAISGFHIGMVAWLFAWAGASLVRLPMAQRCRLTAPDLRAVFGMSAAVGYSLLAGMSVPTQRTLIMLAVYFGASLLRRETNVWHSFGLALLLVLMLDPFAPLAVGAWLSFGAVAVILLNQHGRLASGPTWREFLNMQAVVTVGLVPLLLSSFGSLSLVSPWVNLLAIPVFTAVLVPLVLVGCGLLLLQPAAGAWWLHWLARLLDVVYAALQWAADLSWASWYAPQAAPWAMGLLVFGTLLMVLPWLWTLRLTGALCCLPALAWRAPLLPDGAYTMTTLDVGQGLAVVIQTRSHVLLYDAGPKFQSGRDTGELVILPYLHAMGIGSLDMVVASHGDDDHVGGLKTVLHGLPVRAVLPGPSVQLDQPITEYCQRGQHWQWDGVQFEVLHPGPEHAEESDNNRSCVVRIASASGSVLLLGDIEKRIELGMVAAGLIKPTTIVEAAHHGSRSSSTEALITAAQAQWVMVSAGYRNRWDFPKPEVIERWQVAGTAMAVTSQSGAITAALLPGQPITVARYRQVHRRYWQTSSGDR
jgi:competence protein ComEC